LKFLSQGFRAARGARARDQGGAIRRCSLLSPSGEEQRSTQLGGGAFLLNCVITMVLFHHPG
jgi:hypothetical protein